ncbi:MAG: hypothetical protein DRP35_10490 [Candidatus Zixiibacteriota bacterium]|nr:MAG: hypothetical protein DRP35_10490 [candidate division Zixibacteria bacterium]
MRKILFYFLLIILFFSACEKTEDIVDFPIKDPELVVNAMFTSGENFEFQVSRSLSVLDNADLKNLTDATIYLYEDNILIDTITEQKPNEWYFSNKTPVLGKTYAIKVYHQGYNHLEAEDMLPAPVSISQLSYIVKDSSTYYDDYSGESYGNCTFDLTVNFNDPVSSENYYLFSGYSYSIDNYYGDTLKDNIYFDQKEGGNAFVETYSSEGLIFSDKYFNGKSFSFITEVEDWNFTNGKTYFFVLSSLSHDAYLYKKSLAMYENAHNNFFSEPVQVYNNIKNGYGIFAGFSSVTDSIKFE